MLFKYICKNRVRVYDTFLMTWDLQYYYCKSNVEIFRNMTIKTLNIEELVKKKYITPSIDVCGLMEGVVMNGTSITATVGDGEGDIDENEEQFSKRRYTPFYSGYDE